MAENWWLILLVAVVIAVGIWWLVGGTGGARPPLEGETRPETLKRAPEDQPPATPVVIGSAASPLDVAPPPVPVADDARLVEPEPAEAPTIVAADGPPDDLLVMKGVGPKLAALLGELGVTRYDQIARWTDEDIARVDARLGAFRGRPVRDRWVEQAGLLAAGDRPGFEARFGRIDPA